MGILKTIVDGYNHYGPKQGQKVEEVLQRLEQALQAGEILMPDFREASSRLTARGSLAQQNAAIKLANWLVSPIRDRKGTEVTHAEARYRQNFIR
ncbi:MAG: hypothetical protein AB7H77_08950 [Bdellovibrionales bacterium]